MICRKRYKYTARVISDSDTSGSLKLRAGVMALSLTESPLADLEIGGEMRLQTQLIYLLTVRSRKAITRMYNWERIKLRVKTLQLTILQAIDQNIVSEAEEADDAVPPESGEETSTDTQDDGTQDV